MEKLMNGKIKSVMIPLDYLVRGALVLSSGYLHKFQHFGSLDNDGNTGIATIVDLVSNQESEDAVENLKMIVVEFDYPVDISGDLTVKRTLPLISSQWEHVVNRELDKEITIKFDVIPSFDENDKLENLAKVYFQMPKSYTEAELKAAFEAGQESVSAELKYERYGDHEEYAAKQINQTFEEWIEFKILHDEK